MRKLLSLLACLCIAAPSFARAAHTPLELFGQPLKGATRSALESALRKAGLQPVATGTKWEDKYTVTGQLQGASKLDVFYTNNNVFAFATYTFPSFVDPGQVGHIIKFVAQKYGTPNQVHGSADVGDVTATWYVGDGMDVIVHRSWPSTTTYLSLANVAAARRWFAQAHEREKLRRAQEASSQGKAF